VNGTRRRSGSRCAIAAAFVIACAGTAHAQSPDAQSPGEPTSEAQPEVARTPEPEPQTPEEFDTLAVLHAIDTAPAKLLLGPGFRVEDPVATDGLSTRFTIRSDVGVFEAWGVETLALRVAEIPAIRLLDDAFRGDAFGRAAANMAARPRDPGGSGLDRLFAAPGAADGPIVPADHGEELRAAASRLGVDPYTDNPLLLARLDQLAEVAAVSGLSATSLLPASTPTTIAMAGSEVAHHLVYDTPAAELRAKNGERLRSFGATDEQIRAFDAAKGFTLTTQTALVESLARLAEVQGRADVVALAATVATPDQALFLVRAVGILADRNEQAPIEVLLARGTVVARQTSGQIVAPLPADYVAWTERMADFAKREDLAAPERGVWISGRTTSRARQRFEALGWAVHEGVKP
jgi:hypothetical protein